MFTQAVSFAGQSVPFAVEQRITVRHACALEGISRPLDVNDSLSWGATVRDLSSGGVGLLVCYPFRLGTYLTLEIQGSDGQPRGLLARVAHVRDQKDGTWHVGCEFAKHLSDQDVRRMV